MAKSSNLYADRIFSEHPISLYTLDDDVSYLSLISDNQRLFSGGSWSASGDNSASVVLEDNPTLPNLKSPFDDDIYSSFSASGVSVDNTTISVVSSKMFDAADLNEELKTFSLAFYLYQSSIKINWYEVGYVYYDQNLEEDVEVVNRVEGQEGTRWINFDFTYIPTSTLDTNIRILIKANLDSGGSETDYRFIVNGISLGQWSETKSSESLGSFYQSSSVISSSVELFGVEARQYGIQNSPGYYIVENNSLLAKNAGIPIVYGSQNSVRLYPSNTGIPSLIVPGEGFLFDSGKYKEYSIEFWMKIKPNTTSSRKIFGPIDSNNGIYVNNDVVSLVIGNEIASHPVSEWYRPMLIHILLKNDSSALFVNGEQVLEIPFDGNNFNFSEENDWVGFYSYEDIDNFEISCISFYSYIMSVDVSKRRFVYGQGTQSPESIADFFDGTNAYINFSNANFTSNKTYPDTNNWQAGYKQNLLSTRRSIASPNYQPPEIFIEGRDVFELYEDNKTASENANERFFSFRPESQSEINLIPDLFSISDTGGWQKLNNTALQEIFLEDLRLNGLRMASFNQWQRVLTDGTQNFDWNNWSGDNWENVYFFESSGFFAGTKLSQRIPIIPNILYKFSVDVKRVLGDKDDPYISIEWFDSETGGTKIGSTIVSSSISLEVDEWKTLMAQEFAPIGATHAELTIYLSESEVEPGEVKFFSNPRFISPELNWSEPGYIFFDNLTQIESLAAIHGVFSTNNTIDYSPIMSIRNTTSSDKFEIFVQDNYLKYKFNENVLYEEILNEELGQNPINNVDTYGPTLPQFSFAAGIDIAQFSKSFGYQVLQFFKSTNNLQLYVAGAEGKTFSGRIYSIGFSNKNNLSEIKELFLFNGIVDRFEFEDLLNYFSTYTLTPLLRYDRFFLDISISASWEEYFPLTSFASFVKNLQGNKYYDLDYLQINLGYPSVTDKDGQNIDFSRSNIKSYFTFQFLNRGANEPIKNFTNVKKLTESHFIDAQEENTPGNPFKAYSTKFEFSDNVVVFPPKNVDLRRVAIVFHFDIKEEGILSNPVRIRDFEISSRALNQYSFNPIGTESGLPIYPYVKTGIYFDNKEKNPVVVSKKRLPYLNLNQKSGVRVLGEYVAEKEFGVAIPINQQKSPSFDVGSLQLWMKYDNEDFPSAPRPIFEIQDATKTIEFVIVSDASQKRGFIFPRNKSSKKIENDIVLYQGGVRVKNIVLEKNSWESVGAALDGFLNFDNVVGYLNIFRGATFNNISYFNLSGLGETSGILARPWLRVLTEDDISNFDWQYWLDENGTSEIKQWRDVYVVEETRSFLITPAEIYKTYVGTNRTVVDDEKTLNLETDQVLIYSSSTKTENDIISQRSAISWSRFSDIPV